MWVQGEVEVPPQLLHGAAAPVFKHVQVDAAPELHGAGTRCEREMGPACSPGPSAPHC